MKALSPDTLHALIARAYEQVGARMVDAELGADNSRSVSASLRTGRTQEWGLIGMRSEK